MEIHVSWSKLLASRRLQHHKPTVEEISSLGKLIDRDLEDAALTGLSADRRFATAYNAVLQLSKLAIACEGYRVSASMGGHHLTTFQAVRLALGPTLKNLVDYFETCRRMRNVIDYDSVEVASEIQSHELLDRAIEYKKIVQDWMHEHHRQLLG